MAARKKMTPKNFKAAYQILKTNAEELQNSDEPDIDNLMKTVEESIDAYKVCQSRIEAVQRALDAAFEEDTFEEDTFEEDTDNAVAQKAMQAAKTTDATLSNKAALGQQSVATDDDKQEEGTYDEDLLDDEE